MFGCECCEGTKGHVRRDSATRSSRKWAHIYYTWHMSSHILKSHSTRVKAKFLVSLFVLLSFALFSGFKLQSRIFLKNYRRKSRFMSRDVDSRKTLFSNNFGGVGTKKSVRERGSERMIAAKEATRGDLSTSLSACSSNTDQEADELIYFDAWDFGDDDVSYIIYSLS